MEDAVAASDFVMAVHWRDQRQAVHEQIQQVLAGLLGGGTE
jgi:hypothetical protein